MSQMTLQAFQALVGPITREMLERMDEQTRAAENRFRSILESARKASPGTTIRIRLPADYKVRP